MFRRNSVIILVVAVLCLIAMLLMTSFLTSHYDADTAALLKRSSSSLSSHQRSSPFSPALGRHDPYDSLSGVGSSSPSPTPAHVFHQQQRLSVCEPASVETELDRFGRQADFGHMLPAACDKKCRSVPDPAKRPPDTSATWRPAFCAASAGAEGQPRMDHGCYKSARNTVEDDRQEERNVVEDGCHGGGVTAVFSTLGERFYGPGGQEYVWESIRQWRLFHPASPACEKKNSKKNTNTNQMMQHRIFMITNSSRLKDPRMIRNASFFHVELVGHEDLYTAEWRRYDSSFYIQGYMHPGGSRTTGNKNFNRLVTARFFAMHELMRRQRLKHVVHLENDMMVYLNFAETVSAVRSCGWRLASLFPHFSGIIPGLLYIRSPDDLAEFTSFVNDLLSCGKKFGELVQSGYANDMTYLKNFFMLRGGEWMGDLPSVRRQQGSNCVADKLPNLLHDGASFGQWYSFAVKSNPPALLSKLPVCRPSASSSQHDDDGAAGDKRFFTTGCAEWEDPLKRHFQSIQDDSPISTAKPPENIRLAMKKGRFVDATPGRYVRWRREDTTGLLVPWWESGSDGGGGGDSSSSAAAHVVPIRLSSLHIHAKNLYLFRSR